MQCLLQTQVLCRRKGRQSLPRKEKGEIRIGTEKNAKLDGLCEVRVIQPLGM